MSVATPSRVVTMANDTCFGTIEGYLAPAVAPTLCETAVLVAAIGAGAAVAACAGYVANAWANNVGHGRGRHVDDVETLRSLDVAGGSLTDLVGARAEILG